ncbi:MAG: aromatic aminobenezylarsenical efflux permease ArsG family transporter [Bacteroidales bacterium]
MIDWLHSILASQSTPVLTALALGIVLSISPCPLTTNVLAIAYLNRSTRSRSASFLQGLYYTLGVALTYTSLAAIIVLGANQFQMSAWFQLHSEKILAPLLVLIGLILTGLIPLPVSGFFQTGTLIKKWEGKGGLSALFLGMLFALAFCPNSAVLYFGVLMPLTLARETGGLLLPVLFSLAASVPVVIVAGLLSFTLSGIDRFYRGAKRMEPVIRKVVAFLFIGVGIYEIIVLYF